MIHESLIQLSDWSSLLFQKAETKNLSKGEFRFSDSHFCLTVCFDHWISLLDNAMQFSRNEMVILKLFRLLYM